MNILEQIYWKYSLFGNFRTSLLYWSSNLLYDEITNNKERALKNDSNDL